MNAAVNLDTLARAMNEHAMVSLTDRDGRLVYVNDRLCAISGYARDELLGRDHRILKSEAYSPEFFARLWQSLARGEVRRAQLQNRHRDGSMYWVEATMLAEFDEDGVPIHYLVVRTDVTRRERLRAGFEALAHEAGEQTLGTIVQAMVEHLGVQRAGVAVAPSAEGDFDVVEFDRERGGRLPSRSISARGRSAACSTCCIGSTSNSPTSSAPCLPRQRAASRASSSVSAWSANCARARRGCAR